MDIRHLSRRMQEFAAYSSRADGVRERQGADASQAVAQAAQAAQVAPVASTESTAAETTAEQPAALSRFTPAGRLLHVLQSFETRHPEQTKHILSNIADKLRSDAEQAGRFGERLTRWADRFQEAADSGDMSKLMPRLQPHFGMRAYQQAQQPEGDETVEHVAGTAETQANAAPPAAESGEISNTAASETATGDNTQVQNRPVTVPESATSETSSDLRNRPVTVPESSTAERSSDMRHRPVTVPDSSQSIVTE